MTELFEFWITNKYAHLLLEAGEGSNNGSSTIIRITREDPKFQRIELLQKQVREKYDDFFFLYSDSKREYGAKEINNARLFQFKIRHTFEPAGEECGTIFNEETACQLCGSDRKQIGSLMLKAGSIPKKDIARTIAGEVVVSGKFKTLFKARNLNGAEFGSVISPRKVMDYYQLSSTSKIELTPRTIAGANIFDFTESSPPRSVTIPGAGHFEFAKEVYKCPMGHSIGLNLLSEAFVFDSPKLNENDFLTSRQNIGVKRGLLRPNPIYLCSPGFRRMVIEEKLKGFEFEVAHIEDVS